MRQAGSRADASALGTAAPTVDTKSAVEKCLRYAESRNTIVAEVPMSTSVAEIEAQIRALGPEDKAILFRALIAELDGPSDEAVQRAWLEEAQRRYREIENGNVEPVAAERVFSNLRARLKQ